MMHPLPNSSLDQRIAMTGAPAARLLSSVAVVALLAAGPAHAQCVVAGDAATCADVPSGGFVAPGGDGSDFNTTDTTGIEAEALGGDGGSVAVNNDAAITVNGDGGAVAVVLGARSAITTAGDEGVGVLAESRGGDGGSGGNAVAGVPLGSAGGEAGSGGTVLVNNAGAVSTGGDAAHAISASSIGAGDAGGGGGLMSLGGNGGGASNGDAVRVVNTGALATSRANAHGVLAQSLGGTAPSAAP